MILHDRNRKGHALLSHESRSHLSQIGLLDMKPGVDLRFRTWDKIPVNSQSQPGTRLTVARSGLTT